MGADPEIAVNGHKRAAGCARGLLTAALVFVALIFSALGSWQVQRLFWKLDLIERVEARIHAEAAPAPSQADWGSITAQNDEYSRVRATGVFDHGKAVLVQAVTARGAGFWVVTPLKRDDGSTILINRGFVPSDRRATFSHASGTVEVTGLLRMTEPGGGFLRSNDPGNDRWFSRDVAAITAAKALSDVAPYFIDADATPNLDGLPVGGMTVVRFANSHLVYALTWFAMAVMSAGAAYAVYRQRFR